MSAPPPEAVRVDLPEGGYEIVIGSGTFSSIGERTVNALGRAPGRAMLVEDTGAPAKMREHARVSLEAAGYRVTTHTFTPSEQAKSLASLESILVALAESRHERTDPVIALGGGVTGDLAGFAAAVYRRGVPIVQAPTTLLAMVDASVGGKTAANLTVAGGLKKNFVGAFWQPELVLIDTDALRSLDDRTYRCGLAECVKHGMLSGTGSIGAPDAGLLAWTGERADELAGREGEAVAELVARNVAVKAAVVAGDQRETTSSGGRSLLNLGHTFAHTIEPMPALSPTGNPAEAPLQHGEAVALGLVAACAASERLGLAGESLRLRVCSLLDKFGLPTRIAGLPETGALIAAMGDDKKVASGRVRLVVPEGECACRVVDAPSREALGAGWAAIRAGS